MSAIRSRVTYDVFWYILSSICEPTSIYSILRVIPASEPYFGPALRRLCNLPIVLSLLSPGDSCRIIDLLLDKERPIAIQPADLRYLVIQSKPTYRQIRDSEESPIEVSSAVEEGFHERVVRLLKETPNLQRLDWHGFYSPRSEHSSAIDTLKNLCNLKSLYIKCLAEVVSNRHLTFNSDIHTMRWNPDNLISIIGRQLTHLDLQSVTLEILRAFANNNSLAQHPLKSLALDLRLIEDSALFNFGVLGFPSVEHVTLRNITHWDNWSGNNILGPLTLIPWGHLKSLSLQFLVLGYYVLHASDLERSTSWRLNRGQESFLFPSICHLFTLLPPAQFPLLEHLEIQTHVSRASPFDIYDRYHGHLWEEEEEEDLAINTYLEGLVPRFLKAIRDGFLQNFVSLWVDQNILSLPSHASDPDRWYTVTELWADTINPALQQRKEEWKSILKGVFSRLESLRVGFGPMTSTEVGLILGCCLPDKLTQFGFQYKWSQGSKQTSWAIAPELLMKFLPLPKLKDVHLLAPRPSSRNIYTSPKRSENKHTLDDVEAIFAAVPHICRVGVGHGAVWERASVSPGSGINADTPTIVRIGDPDCTSRLLSEAIPRFFYGAPLVPRSWEEKEEQHPVNALAREVQNMKELTQRLWLNTL